MAGEMSEASARHEPFLVIVDERNQHHLEQGVTGCMMGSVDRPPGYALAQKMMAEKSQISTVFTG